MGFRKSIQKERDAKDQLKELKEEFKNVQEELHNNEYRGFSDCGLVQLVIDGNANMKSIKIDLKVLDEKPHEVEGLIKKAYDNAMKKANLISPTNLVNLVGQVVAKRERK
jgi:DNA-binding YbaB/EbfC family protein